MPSPYKIIIIFCSAWLQ